MRRNFAAPRPVVFEAWTRAEHVRHWWDPSGAPLAICEIDLRPNGRFRWVNQGAKGEEYPFAGIYVEIAAPERIVLKVRTYPESVATLIFSEKGSGTSLTMTIECASVAARDELLQMRVDTGTACTLDNLAKYLEGMC
jgi:uncharacterized protein YndB with AHSA1/START domain